MQQKFFSWAVYGPCFPAVLRPCAQSMLTNQTQPSRVAKSIQAVGHSPPSRLPSAHHPQAARSHVHLPIQYAYYFCSSYGPRQMTYSPLPIAPSVHVHDSPPSIRYAPGMLVVYVATCTVVGVHKWSIGSRQLSGDSLAYRPWSHTHKASILVLVSQTHVTLHMG